MLITALGFLLSTPETVRAAVINGSFETGDFTGWTPTTGQATIDTSGFGVTPPQGNYQALLQTCAISSSPSGGCDENTRLPNGAELETFLTLSSGTLTSLGVTEGSAIKQTITANAGDILTFSWNFLTAQAPPEQDFNDFAFFTLSNSLTQLADTFSPLLSDSWTTSLGKATGYQTYTIPIAGNYTLGFGVVDVGDDTANSALLVDNVKLEPASTKVPEPDTILGLLIALGLGAKYNRKSSKTMGQQ
jgi:hypothetical protein